MKDQEKQNEDFGPVSSNDIDFETLAESGISIDKELVDSLEKEIEKKKEEIRNKQYAISFNSDLLKKYEDFITYEAEWTSTEALGIVQISKQIQKIKKDGIKNGVIYMNSLPLEASHYFISKSKGKGIKSAKDFLELYKPFDQALSDAKNDVGDLKIIEQKHKAALQGITLG